MTQNNKNYKESKLWKLAFNECKDDTDIEEKRFLSTAYEKMREKVMHLLSRIPSEMEEFTIHDISHVDALWFIASDVIDDKIGFNPTEAFVFGASLLLHDAGMSSYAYKNGLAEIKETVEYRDRLSCEFKNSNKYEEPYDLVNPPDEIHNRVLPLVLRRLHADQAEKLAEISWTTSEGDQEYLIENSTLRHAYSKAIGKIAKSHGYPVEKLETEVPVAINSRPDIPTSKVDGLKIACLLRIADALHIDCERAPSFLQAILNLNKNSEAHFAFQKRMSRFEIEEKAVVFRTEWTFKKNISDAWWLGHDMLVKVDQEIKHVNKFLESKRMSLLKVNGVKGIESPEVLAEYIKTERWQPANINLSISDVGTVINRFGGVELYGDNPLIPIRELIQNGRDAIQARRLLEERPDEWGNIIVGSYKENNDTILYVEDNGIGMSKFVLTEVLLDFGKSLWSSSEALDEFPGLMSLNMNAIGKFGIGFFTVFLLGSVVRVYTRRVGKNENIQLLEFTKSNDVKPILSPYNNDKLLIDGGTRVEVMLHHDKREVKNFIDEIDKPSSLGKFVGSIAPCLDVELKIDEFGDNYKLYSPNDWDRIKPSILLNRICNNSLSKELFQNDREHKNFNATLYNKLMKFIIDKNNKKCYGRAFINVLSKLDDTGLNENCIVVNGLRANSVRNLSGIVFGDTNSLDRNKAKTDIDSRALSDWATKQAKLAREFVEQEDLQAKIAEVVLCCGGDIENLKIVKIEEKWYSHEELIEYLQKNNVIIIIFDNLLEFSAYKDDVTWNDFEENFQVDEDILIIQDYDGEIFDSRNYFHDYFSKNWVESSRSKIFNTVKKTIEKEWKNMFSKTEGEVRIGAVRDEVNIERYALVYTKNEVIDTPKVPPEPD